MSGKSKGGNTVAAVWALAQPIAEQLGLRLWDVRFVKEGVSWYLRIFIDKDEGVGIEDCESMSRAVDGPLDELDPIEQSYFLEVCSPGIERELTRPEHFDAMAGSEVVVSLYRAINGQKELRGVLVGLKEKLLTLELEDGSQVTLEKQDYSSVHTVCDF